LPPEIEPEDVVHDPRVQYQHRKVAEMSCTHTNLPAKE